jgi:hypothetical protein
LATSENDGPGHLIEPVLASHASSAMASHRTHEEERE